MPVQTFPRVDLLEMCFIFILGIQVIRQVEKYEKYGVTGNRHICILIVTDVWGILSISRVIFEFS